MKTIPTQIVTLTLNNGRQLKGASQEMAIDKYNNAVISDLTGNVIAIYNASAWRTISYEWKED